MSASAADALQAHWWDGLIYPFYAWILYGVIATLMNPHCMARRWWAWATSREVEDVLVDEEDAESSNVLLTSQPSTINGR